LREENLELADFESSFNKALEDLEKQWRQILPPEDVRFEDQGYIRDPVHGHLRLDSFDFALLDLPFLQRMRHIAQLSFVNNTYPGANHPRFEHLIGVATVATRIVESLQRQQKTGESTENRDIAESDIRNARVSGLFHDIGHLPFSHALEPLLKRETKALASEMGIPRIGEPHEYLTFRLLQTPYVVEIIERINEKAKVANPSFVLDLELIRNLVSGLHDRISSKDAFLLDVIHGETDADRIDYLLRDGYYTGATHGAVDKERLFETLCIVSRGSGLYLGIKEKGLESVEGLYTSRDLMYSTVYLHHTARIAETMLLRAMAKALPDYETRLGLLQHNDETCLRILGEHTETRKTLERLVFRRFLKRCDVVGMRNFKSKDWSLVGLKPGDPEQPATVRAAITGKLDAMCGQLTDLEKAIAFEDELSRSVKLDNSNDIPVVVDCPSFELPTVPDIESGKEAVRYRYPVLLTSGKDVPLIHVSALVFSILMYEKTFRPKLIVATNERSRNDVKNAFRGLLASKFSMEVSDD
jgi:HD superfamily phosphohydrolase